MSTCSKYFSAWWSRKREYRDPWCHPRAAGWSPWPWCQQNISQHDLPSHYWTNCFSGLYLLWPGQLLSDLPSSEHRTLFLWWWHSLLPGEGIRTNGTSTVTYCTHLLSESHWQRFFARISIKSSEMDTSSCTGDSLPQQFYRKTHSILMEDIVNWKLSWCQWSLENWFHIHNLILYFSYSSKDNENNQNFWGY